MTQLDKAARTILKECLNIKAQESVLIVTEESLREIGEALWNCAKKVSNYPLITRFSPKNLNLPELPAAVFSSLKNSDTVIFLTQKCVDEQMFEKARQNGTRFVVLQNTSKELIERSLEANYKLISNLSRRLADIFSIGKNLYLKTPSGTETQIAISRIKGNADTGLVHKAGELTYLPAGEACLYLPHNNIEGRIILDGIAGYKKFFAKPIVLFLKNGQITQIKGEKPAEQLRKDIRKFGKNGRRIHELGVGTNNKVALGNSAQEDEKALGTVHIVFGQKHITKVRGKIIPSIKGILLNPTLSVDGKLIVEDGNLSV
ncbi:MAG: hypothetical protein ACE5JB_13110 [bacterium]